MTTSILGPDSKIEKTGVCFRKPTLGPEGRLVDWFLEQDAFEVPLGCNLTIFREPRIESGFPDLVAVVWDTETSRTWTAHRRNLTVHDLKILHFMLYCGKPCTEQAIGDYFPSFNQSLIRLELAETIYKHHGCWYVHPKSRIFAAKEIIAIEAKIGDFSAVVRQALLNTWFASASFALVSKIPKRNALLEHAGTFGLGVWTKENGRVLDAAPCFNVAVSYVSWMFNEWAWRASMNCKVLNGHRCRMAGNSISRPQKPATA